MYRKSLKRYLAYSLLVASLAMAATSVKPQERKLPPIDIDHGPIVKGNCPRPIALTLPAPNLMSFDAVDFTPGQINATHMTGLGDPSINENYLQTFHWKRDERCCQITRAVLTVNVKANSTCQSHTSGDSGNDGINIMYNQSTVPPYADFIYGNNGTCQPATYQRVLNAATLQIINQTGRLSFAVQDDTQVVSATLQLSGCCLTAPPVQAPREHQPQTDETE